MPTRVREIIRQLESDGWFLVTTRGSHRQYKHPTKSGRVTVPGKPSDDLHPATLKSILRQAGLAEWTMRYAIVIEKGERNYSAYVPDLPGCVATGKTVDEVKSEIRDAIAFHLEGMQEDGEAIPMPTSRVDEVDVVIKAA
jgi:predicted RNA binding protein YcfA (HicA-like mRNA interferase family)/predicted RNase H-like HicB family nuclease